MSVSDTLRGQRRRRWGTLGGELIFVQRRRLFAVGKIETDVKAQTSSKQASLDLFR